ncbi:hypothetical protein [Maricaulis sp.]|uniref:hypothetical protein n=1 Tax=Maricaulis sp. TaxID=1486257 RepID=UPI00261375ED|nr:hypothetical protein [Maricaulis sp.]
MIALASEARRSIGASWRMLTFKEGWREGFDVSLGGFWRSFAAAVLALPLVALILAGGWHAGGTIELGRFAFGYALSWAIFPLAAAAACAVTGARTGFVPWVVVHNWAVLWLYAFQALFWTLHTAGLFTRDLLELSFFFYTYLRILVHWRIAYASLGLPTITSALAAAVPILAGEITVTLLYASARAAQASGG